MKTEIFNEYSRSFAWVTPYCVSAVYEEAASHAVGAVVDCGCGPCKLAPYLVGSPLVESYSGVDYSPEMVALGRQLLGRLADNRFKVQCCSVEDITGAFDFAVSLQSYYAWKNPRRALKCIYNTLVAGGKLVLASANNKLDIDGLLQEASRDWLLNPLWQEYAAKNRQIAGDQQCQLHSLDSLIGELREVGFEITDAHAKHYNGGLNFIVAKK